VLKILPLHIVCGHPQGPALSERGKCWHCQWPDKRPDKSGIHARGFQPAGEKKGWVSLHLPLWHFFRFLLMTLELVLFNESEMYSVTSSETIYSFETILFSESTTRKTESELKIN